jgi:hypothetical protein
MIITQEIMEFVVIGMNPGCELHIVKYSCGRPNAQGKTRQEVSEEDHGEKSDQFCYRFFLKT